MYRRTDMHSVKITDGFWKEKRAIVANVTVPYIWEALNNRISDSVPSGAVENFEIAAGDKNISFHGLVSQDSDLFKWMEAAALSLEVCYSKETERNLESAIALLERAQQKDGYLNSYYIINGLKNKWSYLKESCQLYCAGHLIEAAVSYYEVTGKRNLMDIACLYADCIDRNFGPENQKIHGYDGHAEIELALFRLYKITDEIRYKTLAEYFVEERGKKPYFFNMETANKDVMGNLVYALSEENFYHSQSHLPIRQQKEAVGHAVKAMYFYTAATDMAILEDDDELFRVVKNLWEDVTCKKMFLTGAIGSAEYGESFTYDYDLPGDLMYGETCASIGLFFWAYRMLQKENNSCYADVMEKTLYNNILSGISENGTEFFYTNVLDFDIKKCMHRKDFAHIMPKRQSWFDCPCCPPNIARTILSLNNYICTYDDDSINIHHYISSDIKIKELSITMTTSYPEDGIIKLKTVPLQEVSIEKSKTRFIRLRLPAWCRKYSLMLDGIEQHPNIEGGYLVLNTNWSAEHTLYFNMEIKPEKVYASDKVSGLQGKVAVMRGPVVYCAEEADNGELGLLSIKANGILTEAEKSEPFKMFQITAQGYKMRSVSDDLYHSEKPMLEEKNIIMIPYRLWNNRRTNGMKVFIREK